MYLAQHQIASVREQAASRGLHGLVALCDAVRAAAESVSHAAERADACSCRECGDGIRTVGGRCPLALDYDVASRRADSARRELEDAIDAAEIDTDPKSTR